jgi:hypothetical protein
MNKLVERIRKDDFPVLFGRAELYSLNFDKKETLIMFDEAIKNEWINNVYEDIYKLGVKYQTTIVSEEAIAQKIVPNSYVSLNFILSQQSWIPEAIFTTTSVTYEEEMVIKTKRNGKYSYRKLYDKINMAGIYTVEDESGIYKVAKPLRALCDLIRLYNEKWNSVEEIHDTLRIDYADFEDLTAADFDELQGTFNIENIETMLWGIRSDLKI